MTRSFRFTPESEADALAIWEYMADETSEASADRLLAACTMNAKSSARRRDSAIFATT